MIGITPSSIINRDSPEPALPRHQWLWQRLNLIAAYCLLNLLDDPALLAMAFC